MQTIHAALVALQSVPAVAFHVGPLAVRWYGIAYAVAFLAAFFLIRSGARRRDVALDDDALLTVVLYAIIGVVLGGRLGYVLFYGRGYYVAHPAAIFRLWDGGMSFHGGFLGSVAALALAARREKISFADLADLAATAAPLGFFLGRIANYINGELWGRVTTSAWGIVFASAGARSRIPSQLIEAVLEGIVLFVIMNVLARREPRTPSGEIAGWMMVLYGCFRIFAECFREPDVGIGFLAGGWLTMGMLLSIPLVIVGAFVIVRARRGYILGKTR